MATYSKEIVKNNPLLINLKHIPTFFLHPITFFQTYNRQSLRPDIVAGLTVAVILLPQAIAFALVAELPPAMGLYAAIIGGAIGALWGSSYQMQTGPANAISLLVLSSLLAVATPGTPEFLVAAGMMAVMAGIFQLTIGVARLGMLVNFVSHSVIVGFAGGAGLLIAIGQLRHLLGLKFSSLNLLDTTYGLFIHLSEIHWPTTILGIGTMILIVLLRKLTPKIPAPLLSMIVAAAAVFFLGLNQVGVAVIGQLPSSLPPVAKLPLFNLNLIARLSTGALAVGTIGLIQTTAISRSIASLTGQRLDSSQEFVGQGLANLACGFLSGYPVAGSFSRSAVSLEAGARTPLSAIIAGLFVLIAMLTLAPLAAYLPRTALAGVLILTAFNMVDQAEIKLILQGTRGDAIIMLVTFLGTLFLPLEFAVMTGVLLSFAHYIMKTSMPRVYSVLPDQDFKHFVLQELDQSSCPQLGIIKISGDLYFGAVNHVEETISQNLAENQEQRFLLLRMQGVNHCDVSGIHMLEAIRRSCQERGGDLFLMKVQKPVYAVMESTGFCDRLGRDHFLMEDLAIGYLFYKILDPAICIYECEVRAFKECQNLPKRTYSSIDIPLHTDIPPNSIASMSAQVLHDRLRNGETPPLVIDVREPREFKLGHIPYSQLVPLPKLLADPPELPLPRDHEIVLVCRSGRRSTRAAYVLQNKGFQNLWVLQGGILAWETTGYLEAVDIA